MRGHRPTDHGLPVRVRYSGFLELVGHMRINHLKRREFISLGGAALAWPLAARAQVSADHPLIACLSAGLYGRAPLIAGFQEEMRDLGYYAGRNIDILYRFAENAPGL